MKKLLFILFLFVGFVGFGQCPTTDITLMTQAQVDAFPTNYPGCTNFTKSLTIGNSSNITNLNGLAGLTSITGNLTIKLNSSLTNLNGLNGLTSVGGTVEVYFNTSLTSLNGLNNLVSIGADLNIWYNHNLTNLTGLSSLTTIGYEFKLNTNNGITNLNGAPNLNSVNRLVFVFLNNLTNFSGFPSGITTLSHASITNNPALTTLTGLENLTNVTGSFYIDLNNSLANLTGLNNLKKVSQTLQISFNNNLANLNGLTQLNTVGENFIIWKNPLLTSLSSLGSLQNIGGYLRVIENNSLPNLTGLNNLTNIKFGGIYSSGGIVIQDNNALNSISALSNVTSKDLLVQIINNDALTNLNGLGNIGNNITKLEITFNALLSSLTTFSKLTNVYDLLIFQNPALTSLAGLENVTKAYNLTLTTNNALTSFSGLANLVEVVNDCTIKSNTSYSGLNSLTTVNNLYLTGNATNLTGLGSLKTVKNTMQLLGMPSITNLTGVTNLTYIGTLSIQLNPSLTSLNGLNYPLAIKSLIIQSNPILTTCAVQPICNSLALSSGAKTIGSNGTNCNSIAQVNALCSPLPPPIPQFEIYLTTVCLGTTGVPYYTQHINDGGTYNWSYSGTGVSITPLNVLGNGVSLDFANNATSGILSVTATNSSGTSPARTLSITVGPPNPPDVQSSTTIFSGEQAYLAFSPNNCAGKWYNQASGGTLLQTGSTYTTPFLNTSTTYYVECDNGVNCVSNRTPILVTVIPQTPNQPANFTTSTASVCQGAIGVVYTVPNVSGVTYNWSYSGTGATINGSGNSITVNFANNATSGTLSVTATNSAGTSAARTLAITVTASPSAPTASGVTINAGGTASLTATGCTTYKWYDQATGGTLLQSAATAGFTTPVLYANTTYYAACESGTCVSTRTSVLVTVTVLPPAQPGNFTVSTASVCQGVTGVVYTVPNVSGVTYNWSYSGTGATINGSGNSITVNFANNATSGTLSVTATNSAGTSAARTLAITVTATPAAPTASGVTINAGATASLTATGCTTYKWYDQSTGGTLLQSAATAGFTTPNLYANTTYYVACANGTCESGRTSVLVTVTGGSSALLVAHYPFCGNANDATANANNATVSGATLTTDRFGKTNSAYSFNGNEYIEAPSNAALQLGIGDYSFAYWFKTNSNNSPMAAIMKNDANDGYSGLGSYLNYPSVGVVLVRSKYGQDISTNSPAYNDNVWHYVTYTRQGNTQKLYVDNILKVTNTNNSPVNISNSRPLAFGTFNDGHQQYFMGALDDIKIYSGALSQSEILAEFNSTGGVPTIGSNSPICAGNTLNLTSTTANSYAWTGVNGFASNAQNPSIINVSALATGTYMVSVTNAGGCVATATTSVTINTVLSPTANGVTILSGNTASLTATGCSTYKWYSQATGGLATFTGQNFTTPILTSNTNYYVACNAVTSCESARILVVVTVLPCTQMISIKTGSWNDPTVWSCNRVPTATDNITINTGHNVTVPAGTFMVKNVTDKGTLSYALNGILRILGGV
jgi:hypothetical protein